MGIFRSILDKLRRHSSTEQQAAQPASGSGASPQGLAGQAPQGAAQSQQTAQAAAPEMSMQNVDVDAVLSQLASEKGGGGNYRQSIVDLLKLLDLDSSLAARKELAQELGVNAGAHGSAEQNIALHKAVMRKIEENGGKVPASLRD
jgi:hypothetical protein